MSGAGTVEIHAAAHSILPIHRLEVVQQGRVVAATEEARGARSLELRAQVKIDGHSWLAARCGGPDYTAVPHHDGWRRGIFAHTSPVYIAVGGEWEMFDPQTAEYMLTLIGGGLEYIRKLAPLHQPGTVTHHHHHESHQQYLEQPFHEAAEAIHRRMHRLGIPH
jgi:hypothetical protein